MQYRCRVSLLEMIATALIRKGKTFRLRTTGVLAVLVGLPLASASGAEDRLKAIIENVRENEALYENLEVRWHTEFRIEKPKRTYPIYVAASDEDSRSVFQGGLLYLNVDGQNKDLGGGTRSLQTLQGFDGSYTRVFSQNAIGNIIKGRFEDPRMFRPHILLLQYDFVNVPLSNYLKGDDAIRAHPLGGSLSDFHFIVKYLGEEQCGGFTCQKVSLDYIGKVTGKPVLLSRFFLWLAPQRNYLPLKTEGYNIQSSAKLPVAVGVVEELRELSPGTWFPFRATHATYDEYRIREDNQAVVAGREEYAVQEASLNPHYPLSLFRDITIPDGVPVYEIENGKIVRKYVQGQPDTPETRSPSASARRWWMALFVSVGVAAIVVLILRQRARGA